MVRPLSSLCPLLAAVALASAPSLAAQDHQLRAEQAVVRLGLEGLDGLSLESLLAQAFVRVPAGGVDLYMTAHALTASGAPERLLEVASGVLRAQGTLLEWTEPDATRLKAQIKALEAEVKLLSKPKGKALARAFADGTPGELAERLEWKDSQREQFAELATSLAAGELLGGELEGRPLPVLLAWDRNEFGDLLALGGILDPTARPFLWVEGTQNWTHFFVQEARVWSLVNPDGSSMDREDRPTLTRQQIEQLAVGALLEHWSGGHLPAALIAGLALEVVVATEEECDTRLDGDLRARSSQAWEMFVPGGLSEGGILPAMPAATRWREFRGSDHFVTKLRQTQNDGIEDRRREGGEHHFRLLADDGVRTRTVSGPFLGAAALGRDLPAAFQGDWLEFVRAYRAGFLFWLRTEAGKNARDSGARFGQLLRELVQAPDPAHQEGAWEAVVGLPLSSPGLEAESLEGRFLSWLRRQRG
jgi:hypothetical protein